MPDVKFRKALPQDAALLASLLYDSGPEAFDYVFTIGKKSALDFLSYSLQKKGGEFGYNCHTCVLLDEEVVGVGAEFSGKNNLSFLWNNARQILSFYPLPVALGVILRGLRVERVLVPPKKNVHYIAHLDIAPNKRGQGIGESLIRYFIIHAQQNRQPFIELDVALTNPQAMALYTRIGFVIQHLRQSTLTRKNYQVPSYYRMEMPNTG
jgi:ribosomal protein S18 acetylase RimI-like enzyme